MGSRFSLVLFLIGVLFMVEIGFCDEGKNWQDVSKGIPKTEDILCINGVDGTGALYAGTESGLYKTVDFGRNWIKEELYGGKVEVTEIAFSSGKVLASTNKGLYISGAGADEECNRVSGKRWLIGVAATGDQPRLSVFAWRKDGLFLVTEESWERRGPGVLTGEIEDAAYNDGVIYLASGGSLYYSFDMGKSWNKYFLVQDTKKKDQLEEGAIRDEEEKRLPPVRKIDTAGPSGVTIATGEGIFLIDFTGNRIKRIDTAGLPSSAVSYALNTGEEVFASAGKSIFVYPLNRTVWYRVFESAATGKLNRLKVIRDRKGESWLFAATDRCIYRIKLDKIMNERQGLEGKKTANIKKEPDIRKVQRMVVEYAEVSPEKIKRWRKGARWKAILPRLSLNFSESYDDNIEIYKNSSKSYVIEGPREKDNDWGVGLTWDLSDLIWNESQTSIDVRSKLMVQLREDLLEEVTRLYFERKRILERLEKRETGEKKDIMMQMLRVEELTAYIDALTGGRFSEALEGR